MSAWVVWDLFGSVLLLFVCVMVCAPSVFCFLSWISVFMIGFSYAIPFLCLWIIVSSDPIWSSGICDSGLLLFVYRAMKRNEGRGRKAREFEKQGGFLAWHDVCVDSGSNTKRDFYANKHCATSITSLLPSVGRPPAHQEAAGSVARRKNIRWDAEQEEKTKKRYTVSDMARRLATGRTPEHLVDELSDGHKVVFGSCPACMDCVGATTERSSG